MYFFIVGLDSCTFGHEGVEVFGGEEALLPETEVARNLQLVAPGLTRPLDRILVGRVHLIVIFFFELLLFVFGY